MRFQSKYRNYKLMFRPSRWGFNPDQTRTLVKGITIDFEGPQRIYDTEKAERLHGWEKGTREEVENFILRNAKYGRDIYLAAGQELTQKQQDIARVKPKEVRRFCKEIGFNADGEISQCSKQPAVGKDYCDEHDPERVQIRKGLTTTKDATA
jgi:hypothetical protein